MKTRRLIAGVLAAGVLVTACGDDAKPAAVPGAIDCQPVKPGVLSVVTHLPSPNFWGTSENGVSPSAITTGFEFDFAGMVAGWCGLTMEFRDESLDGIASGQVDPASYDVVISQVKISDDFAKDVEFSVGYLESDQGLLVTKGTEVATWDDVKKLAVGVVASSTAELNVTTGEVPGWQLDNVTSFADLASAKAALAAGTVDGILADTPVGLGEALQSGGTLEVVAQFETGQEYGAIVGKGSGKKDVIDTVVNGIIDDGSVAALAAKYFGDLSTVPFVEVG
jgi:polar amino acid transport system substrate-binding protein